MEQFGMVLAGGGAKGSYQVGVFRALREYDIEITAVSGSSIGGINAFAFATMSQERLEALWDNFTFDDFVNLDDDWSDGLSDRTGLERILDECVSSEMLVNAIPVFNTICQDKRRAEYKLLNNKTPEDIKKIILATSAMPLIYSTVNIDGIEYTDGGVADNLPVYPLYINDYRNLVVVGLNKEQRVDTSKYKLDKLIEIVPSYDLGELFTGTLNFNKRFLSYARKLGYADAKRTLNNYFGIDNGVHTELFDYNQIMHELKAEGLQDDIERNMKLLNKYNDM
ncbi:MAG: patatin-like phospholipase family protein [Lachnospira sp.]